MTTTTKSRLDAGETAAAKAPARSGRRAKRIVLGIGIVAVLGLAVGYALSDVDTEVTDVDRQAIATLGVDAACADVDAFEGQVACVRALQLAVHEAAADYTCVHEYGETSHEPGPFLERARGCCYDRSRLLEKALTHYGLENRHVAIYEGDSWTTLARGGVSSHSLSEVRTERGWMLVDSIRRTVGLGADAQPYDAVSIRPLLRRGGAGLEEADYGALLHGRYVAMYGLYSRHGGFYAPHVPLPDIDWAQLHHNL